jgi:hypothetical protein
LIGVTGSSLVGTVAVIVFAVADGGGGGVYGQPPPLFF